MLPSEHNGTVARPTGFRRHVERTVWRL